MARYRLGGITNFLDCYKINLKIVIFESVAAQWIQLLHYRITKLHSRYAKNCGKNRVPFTLNLWNKNLFFHE